ncbi:hypothetical protein [Dysgonomonas macrotermitis]|uniref:Uncharacterized protein n=1 Tax=Dysgonomonas macrotermitis TaxID=1346286 RepID=A0A1M5C3H1_9BACT|nr:hypothetical protein [Dysgonomonas macrotermitis]SHF49324.1 hypothetical protein SAMN05444362_10718 [Dysgonomonas macrotermitis]
MDDIKEKIEILIDFNDPYYLLPSTYYDIHQEIRGWRLWVGDNMPTCFYKERLRILNEQIKRLELSVGNYEH